MKQITPQEKFAEYMELLNSMELKGPDLYAQYAFMKSSEGLLNTRIEEVRALILEEMQNLGEQDKTFDYGKFTVSSKSSWVFSKKIEVMEDALKKAKEKEKEKGVAKKKDGYPFILFN